MRIERTVAIMAFCFTGLVILLNIIFSPGNNQRVFSKTISIYLLTFDAVMFLLIAIKPQWCILFALVFCYEGLFSTADGEGTVGIIFIFFAISLAFKYGFFRKQKILKILIVIILFIIAICIQVIFIPGVLVLNIFELFLYVVIAVMLYLIFKEDLKRYIQHRPQFSLSAYDLSPKESIYLLASLQGLSMKEVAAEYGAELSCVKTALHRAYQKLHVPDCKTLLIRTKEMDVVP